MAVRRLGYSQVLERELAKGTSLKDAMKKARAKTEVKPLLKRKRKKKARGKIRTKPFRGFSY